MDSEKSDVELKGGANSCDASGVAAEPANCRKCEKPQSGASFWSGILSILFALVTIGLWLLLGREDKPLSPQDFELMSRFAVIFASLCVATGCIALSAKKKGDVLGLAGIALIILSAFVLWCFKGTENTQQSPATEPKPEVARTMSASEPEVARTMSASDMPSDASRRY